jgi:hypothetical protein
MKKIYVILFAFLISNCADVALSIDKNNPVLEIISFDAVEKKILLEENLPDRVHSLLNKWFENKIKINGFDGEVIFTVYDYKQEISKINDGKRVDISMKFQFLLKKPSLSYRKLVEGEVSSFGTLSGAFSLSEFDIIIQNTQSDLIYRLGRDLKAKI